MKRQEKNSTPETITLLANQNIQAKEVYLTKKIRDVFKSEFLVWDLLKALFYFRSKANCQLQLSYETFKFPNSSKRCIFKKVFEQVYGKYHPASRTFRINLGFRQTAHLPSLS